MKLGILKISIILFCLSISNLNADDKIQTVPLINLEELSPTFEEDKDELEDADDESVNTNNNDDI